MQLDALNEKLDQLIKVESINAIAKAFDLARERSSCSFHSKFALRDKEKFLKRKKKLLLNVFAANFSVRKYGVSTDDMWIVEDMLEKINKIKRSKKEATLLYKYLSHSGYNPTISVKEGRISVHFHDIMYYGKDFGSMRLDFNVIERNFNVHVLKKQKARYINRARYYNINDELGKSKFLHPVQIINLFPFHPPLCESGLINTFEKLKAEVLLEDRYTRDAVLNHYNKQCADCFEYLDSEDFSHCDSCSRYFCQKHLILCSSLNRQTNPVYVCHYCMNEYNY